MNQVLRVNSEDGGINEGIDGWGTLSPVFPDYSFPSVRCFSLSLTLSPAAAMPPSLKLRGAKVGKTSFTRAVIHEASSQPERRAENARRLIGQREKGEGVFFFLCLLLSVHCGLILIFVSKNRQKKILGASNRDI